MAEKKKHNKRTINLLPGKKDNVLNDFLSWSLSIGRLLVILTETLALSVFLYRFSLDMKIVDLHDKIKTDSIIVTNFKSGEDTFRNFQDRLEIIKTHDGTRDKSLRMLNAIIDIGRGKVTFKNIAVTEKRIEIVVSAPSATALSIFSQNLRNLQNVTAVSVDTVENKTSNATVTVSITATYQ